MEAQLAESESILAGRVAKEAIRLELSRQRQMTPAKSLRTMTAARIVQGHSDAALGLAEKGFCILEDVLSTSDCRVLYNHFNSALQRGELFGPVSSDACNNGSFSLTRRTEVSGSLTPSSYCELLSFSSPVNLNMPNAASEIAGPCLKLRYLKSRPTNGISGLDSWIIYISFSTCTRPGEIQNPLSL